MEQCYLEEVSADFEDDSDVMRIIDTVRNARKDLETAKTKCQMEKVKAEEAKKLLCKKRKDLAVAKLLKELKSLQEQTEAEIESWNIAKEERLSAEAEISRIETSM